MHRQAEHGLDAAAGAQPPDGLDDRGRQVLFLTHDRDAKFPRAFDAVLDGEKIKVIRTPIQAPNANAHMERWVGSVRRECLDRLLMFGRRQLPPDSSAHSRLGAQTTPRALQVSRRDLLRGLIHEYERAAA